MQSQARQQQEEERQGQRQRDGQHGQIQVRMQPNGNVNESNQVYQINNRQNEQSDQKQQFTMSNIRISQQNQQSQQSQQSQQNQQNQQNRNQRFFQPIDSLHPYLTNWRIKIRVTRRGSVRHFHNPSGEGKVFNCDLLDKDGSQIVLTCFNEAADKFYPLLETNKCLYISSGRITASKKNFTHIKNDYAIILNPQSVVEPAIDDGAIAHQLWNFVSIESIGNRKEGDFVDVCGIVTKVNEISSIMSHRYQREIRKRTINISDDSNKAIEITLWGHQAEEFGDRKDNGDNNDNNNNSSNNNNNNNVNSMFGVCVVTKGARVSEFGGKTLSCRGYIAVIPYPYQYRNPKPGNVLRWWQRGGRQKTINNLIESLTVEYFQGVKINKFAILTVGEAKELGNINYNYGDENNYNFSFNGQLEIFTTPFKPKKNSEHWHYNDEDRCFFETVGIVDSIFHDIDRPPWYKAAPDETHAKVIEDGQGTYFCPKTNKTFTTYEARYILRFSICGSNGRIFCFAFNDVAKQLLGVEANVLERYLKDASENSLYKYESVFENACFKHKLFRIRARVDIYCDETRVKYDCLSCRNVSYADEARKLMRQIRMIQCAHKRYNYNNRNNKNNSNNNNNNNNRNGNGIENENRNKNKDNNDNGNENENRNINVNANWNANVNVNVNENVNDGYVFWNGGNISNNNNNSNNYNNYGIGSQRNNDALVNSNVNILNWPNRHNNNYNNGFHGVNSNNGANFATNSNSNPNMFGHEHQSFL